MAGNRLHFYGDKVHGQENVFVLANHTYWCDWVAAFAFAARLGKGEALIEMSFISVYLSLSISIFGEQIVLLLPTLFLSLSISRITSLCCVSSLSLSLSH